MRDSAEAVPVTTATPGLSVTRASVTPGTARNASVAALTQWLQLMPVICKVIVVMASLERLGGERGGDALQAFANGLAQRHYFGAIDQAKNGRGIHERDDRLRATVGAHHHIAGQ